MTGEFDARADALIGRCGTQLDVSKLRVLDGRVGVWLHDNAARGESHSTGAAVGSSCD